MVDILHQQFSALKHVSHYHNAQSVHRRGCVAATYPWDLFLQHFHVCANIATCPLVCNTPIIVAATCRRDMSLLHDPSCLPTFIDSGSETVNTDIKGTDRSVCIIEVQIFVPLGPRGLPVIERCVYVSRGSNVMKCTIWKNWFYHFLRYMHFIYKLTASWF